MKPYVSIVITGRNDDYGDNFLNRISTFVRSLAHQTQSYPGVFELVIVEWNPLSDRPGLARVLPGTPGLPVRVITVPEHVHQQLNATLPVLEFHGKNVGIRRAHGEFVLVTNPDIIFTDQLIDTLAKKQLRLDSFYRTDRYDFYSNGISDIASGDIAAFALEHVFQGHLCMGSGSASPEITAPSSLNALPVSVVNADGIHTNGCGDFILASKEAFYTARGLVEMVGQKWHLDSYSLLRLAVNKMKQVVWTAPNCIFHMHHDRAPSDQAWNPGRALEIAKQPGNTSWGLAGQELQEELL